MTTADILDGIIEKKKEKNLTSQQLADASNVPKSTIDRILRKETTNPTLQTILDMAAAVGYTFSNIKDESPAAPEATTIKDPMVLHLIRVYEARGQSYEERIKRNTAHFNMLLAEKNRWLKYSLIANIILIVFICSILIIDVMNPDIGWIREHLAVITGDGMRGFADMLQAWLGTFHI